MESIMGNKQKKEHCDSSWTFPADGHSPWGIRNPTEHELAELFTFMRLKTKVVDIGQQSC